MKASLRSRGDGKNAALEGADGALGGVDEGRRYQANHQDAKDRHAECRR